MFALGQRRTRSGKCATLRLRGKEEENEMTSLADMIGAGAEAGDRFRIVGFDPSRHVHTYDGQPVERPEDWVDGSEVVFLGWSDRAITRRARFEINGEVYAGKGLASCILVKEAGHERA